MARRTLCAAVILSTTAVAFAQSSAREQLTRGRQLWDQRLSNSAIAALEAATRDRTTAAEAYEALGRLFTYKGWLQDNGFPGWHDEPEYRQRAIDALKASLAADPSRASARAALQTAERYAAMDNVEPAPPRDEIRALDARLQALRTQPGAAAAEILAAIEARAKAQGKVILLNFFASW